MSEEKQLNVYQRIAKVMAEVPPLQKQQSEGLRYSYVSHDQVAAMLRPLMVKYGLVAVPSVEKSQSNGNRTEVMVVMAIHSVDDPTDLVTVRSLGYGVDTQDKGPGKAISYACKMALLKIFMLETGDDPDHHQGPESDHRPEQGTIYQPKSVGPTGGDSVTDAQLRKMIAVGAEKRVPKEDWKAFTRFLAGQAKGSAEPVDPKQLSKRQASAVITRMVESFDEAWHEWNDNAGTAERVTAEEDVPF